MFVLNFKTKQLAPVPFGGADRDYRDFISENGIEVSNEFAEKYGDATEEEREQIIVALIKNRFTSSMGNVRMGPEERRIFAMSMRHASTDGLNDVEKAALGSIQATGTSPVGFDAEKASVKKPMPEPQGSVDDSEFPDGVNDAEPEDKMPSVYSNNAVLPEKKLMHMSQEALVNYAKDVLGMEDVRKNSKFDLLLPRVLEFQKQKFPELAK